MDGRHDPIIKKTIPTPHKAILSGFRNQPKLCLSVSLSPSLSLSLSVMKPILFRLQAGG